MNNHFFVILLSDSSAAYYPNNTVARLYSINRQTPQRMLFFDRIHAFVSILHFDAVMFAFVRFGRREDD